MLLQGVPEEYASELERILVETFANAPPIGGWCTRVDLRNARTYLEGLELEDSLKKKLWDQKLRRVRRLVPRLRVLPNSRVPRVSDLKAETDAEEARVPRVLFRKEETDAMPTAAANAAVSESDSGKREHLKQGDKLKILLEGYQHPAAARVVSREDDKIVVRFDVDNVEQQYSIFSPDLTSLVILPTRQQDLALREEHEDTNLALFLRDAALSTPKKPNPQPPLSQFPSPAEYPRKYDYIILEIGSGTAKFGFTCYCLGGKKVGVYTIDICKEREPHLCIDLKELDPKEIVEMFPKLVHVHITWDCKANSIAGNAQVPGEFGAPPPLHTHTHTHTQVIWQEGTRAGLVRRQGARHLRSERECSLHESAHSEISPRDTDRNF